MSPSRLLFACVLMLAVSAPGIGAELFKWVDERGVTNYSNEPPPKGTNAKPLAVPEDRISVYTPEDSITREIERAKERSARPPQLNPPRIVEPDRRLLVPPPPPPVGYDPCANPGDPNCAAYLYDRSPVFQGRRTPPPLGQPQLPPGTAILGGGTVPGLSGTAPPPPPPAHAITRTPPQHDAERERDHRRR